MTSSHTTNRPNDLLTLKETQEHLRISHWMLHRLINERQLPSVLIGSRRFIRRGDLEKFIDSNVEGASR